MLKNVEATERNAYTDGELECENIETAIETALENTDSDLVREWAKSIAIVSVTDYEGGYCLSITDNTYVDFIVEVENLNDLIGYTDPNTFEEFSNFEAILEARYCKHYSKGEVIALIQSGFFKTWSNLFWYELAGNNLVDINIIPVSDCEELAQYFLTEIRGKSNVDKFDSFGFLDQIEFFNKEIGAEFKDSVNGVFANDYFIFEYA